MTDRVSAAPSNSARIWRLLWALRGGSVVGSGEGGNLTKKRVPLFQGSVPEDLRLEVARRPTRGAKWITELRARWKDSSGQRVEPFDGFVDPAKIEFAVSIEDFDV